MLARMPVLGVVGVALPMAGPAWAGDAVSEGIDPAPGMSVAHSADALVVSADGVAYLTVAGDGTRRGAGDRATRTCAWSGTSRRSSPAVASTRVAGGRVLRCAGARAAVPRR